MATDPRKQMASTLKRLGKEGSAKLFGVSRPTGREAVARMMTLTAVGKGMAVKGKSAKQGPLKQFVPFVQISADNHKEQVVVAEGAEAKLVHIFFASRKARSAVVQKMGASMLVGEFGAMAPLGVLLETYLWSQDLSNVGAFVKGWPSNPFAMNLNIKALAEKGNPPCALMQMDSVSPLNPHSLVMAHVSGTGDGMQAKPCVSDFDMFVIGTTAALGRFDETHPMTRLASWSLGVELRLLSRGGGSWQEELERELQSNSFIELLEAAKSSTGHNDLGFGDAHTNEAIGALVTDTKASGAVQHGAECYNLCFPQPFDDEFLLIWEELPLDSEPFTYLSEVELQNFLLKKVVDDGFGFGFNPVWALRGAGWHQIFQALRQSGRCIWPDSLCDQVDEIYGRFPARPSAPQVCEYIDLTFDARVLGYLCCKVEPVSPYSSNKDTPDSQSQMPSVSPCAHGGQDRVAVRASPEGSRKKVAVGFGDIKKELCFDSESQDTSSAGVSLTRGLEVKNEPGASPGRSLQSKSESGDSSSRHLKVKNEPGVPLSRTSLLGKGTTVGAASRFQKIDASEVKVDPEDNEQLTYKQYKAKLKHTGISGQEAYMRWCKIAACMDAPGDSSSSDLQAKSKSGASLKHDLQVKHGLGASSSHGLQSKSEPGDSLNPDLQAKSKTGVSLSRVVQVKKEPGVSSNSTWLFGKGTTVGAASRFQKIDASEVKVDPEDNEQVTYKQYKEKLRHNGISAQVARVRWHKLGS